MTELLRELLELIKSMSPEVWSIYIKQVQIGIVTSISWAVILSVSSLFLALKALPATKEKENNDHYGDWGLVRFSIYVSIVFLVLISGFILTHAISAILNPEYYAIQQLIKNLPR